MRPWRVLGRRSAWFENRYDAFVSYSHRGDTDLAAGLQRGLEKFGKGWNELRALRVFRDKTSLALTAELWPEIERALSESGWFVLMASPLSAASKWVDQEICWWLEHKAADHLLIVLTSGTLEWDDSAGDFDWARSSAAPAALRGVFAKEPLWIAARPDPEDAVAGIAAKIRGVPKDQLVGAAIREHRRTMRLAGGAIAGLAILLAAAVVAASVAVVQRSRADHEAHVASVQAAAARRQARVALAGQLAARSETLDDFNMRTAGALAAVAWHLLPGAASADAVAGALQRPREVVLRAHTAPVTGVAFTAGGQRVVTVGDDGDGYLWDAASGALIAGPMTGYEVAPVMLAASPGGRMVATALGNYIYLWDGATGTQTGGTNYGPEYCTDDVEAMAFSPDGRYLAVACPQDVYPHHDYPVNLYGLSPSTKSRELTGSTAPIRALAFSPDGRRLAAVSGDQTQLWAVAPSTRGPVLRGDTAAVTAAAFSPDGRTVLTASQDGTARLWNAATGHQEAILRGGAGAVSAAAFSPGGSEVVTASADGTAWLWKAANGSLIATLTGHTAAIQAAAFDPKQPLMVTASDDGTVRIWDARTGTPIAVLRGDTGPITAIAISPDGRTLATASGDTTARLWDLTFAVPYTTFSAGHGSISSLAFSKDGRTLAVTRNDGNARLFTIAGTTATKLNSTDKQAPRPAASPGGSGALAISPDGSRYTDGSFLYRSATHKEIAALGGSIPVATSAAFSPDGSLLVIGFDDGSTTFYNGRTGNPITTLGGNSPVLAVAFDPNGRTLATASGDGTVRLWNPSTATPIGELTGAIRAVTQLAFSPDGETLASGSNDGTVRLWNAITGAPVSMLPSPTGPVTALAFSLDGVLAASGGTGTVALWHVPATSLANLCARLGGPITPTEWKADVPGIAYEKVC